MHIQHLWDRSYAAEVIVVPEVAVPLKTLSVEQGLGVRGDWQQYQNEETTWTGTSWNGCKRRSTKQEILPR